MLEKELIKEFKEKNYEGELPKEVMDKWDSNSITVRYI
jgi:hypothetical protein